MDKKEMVVMVAGLVVTIGDENFRIGDSCIGYPIPPGYSQTQVFRLIETIASALSDSVKAIARDRMVREFSDFLHRTV